jgi:FdhE protein
MAAASVTHAVTRLQELAEADPSVRSLALLQAEALRAAADPVWDAAAPSFDHPRLTDGIPLLHGRIVQVDSARQQWLLARLADVAERGGQTQAASVRRALSATNLDPIDLLYACVCQDHERLLALAARANLDPDLLGTLGHLAALPLLHACGRAAAPLLEGLHWETGACPVCASWPLLAELRGLERRRFLRCGRCGAEWLYFNHLRCAYCNTVDHTLQGYLAPEAERESRRAVTCDRCHGYLKTFTTLGRQPAGDLLVYDLTSLELDVAALERGYARPETLGFPLDLRVEATARGSRLPWRR